MDRRLVIYSSEKSISRKNPILHIEKFPPLGISRNAIMLQHLIIQFTLYCIICQVFAYGRLKTKENFKVYERYSLTRGVRLLEAVALIKGGSKYSDLRIGKALVFCRESSVVRLYTVFTEVEVNIHHFH